MSPDRTILFAAILASGERLTLLCNPAGKLWIEKNNEPVHGCAWDIAQMQKGLDTFRQISRAQAQMQRA